MSISCVSTVIRIQHRMETLLEKVLPLVAELPIFQKLSETLSIRFPHDIIDSYILRIIIILFPVQLDPNDKSRNHRPFPVSIKTMLRASLVQYSIFLFSGLWRVEKHR